MSVLRNVRGLDDVNGSVVVVKREEVGMAAMQVLPRPRVELRRAIGASGMPAWQIGHLAGISATVLSHIATGRREPRPDEAKSLAAVLGVEVDALFPEEAA
jgi:hypothetical protein